MDSLTQLHPEVANYTFQRFKLIDDLAHMIAVDAVGATEATVLYAGRILEVTARDAVGRAGLLPSSQLFSNMQLIHNLGLADSVTMSWGNALRRLGNASRHLTAPLETVDASLALGFVERWMEWFFSQYANGPRLPHLTQDGNSVLLNPYPSLKKLLADLLCQSTLPLAEASSAAEKIAMQPLFSASSALRGILVESLLGQGETDFSCQLLEQGLAKDPDELRLGQLWGLSQSRLGNLELALAALEKIHRKYPDDDETNGLLAGVQKRLWHRSRERVDHLEFAHSMYVTGWKRSRQQNTYLGINAATTALFLGRRLESEQIAQQVIRVLKTGTGKNSEKGKKMQDLLPFWHQLSLAEAYLLCGDTPEAYAIYQYVAHRFPQRARDLEVAYQQRDEIVSVLGGP